MSQYAWAFVSIGLGAVGQFLLKLGANQLQQNSAADAVAFVAALLKTPLVYVGLACFGTSFLLWVWVLTRMDLSQAYPLVGLGHVLVLALAFIVLREPLSLPRVVGSALVMAGILLIGRS
ncbi:MAG: SMR family transporter [Bacillota bacterium]